MFERQSREAFPLRNILLLALVVLGFFAFIYSLQKKKQTPEQGGLKPSEQFYAMRDYPDFRPDITMYSLALRQAHDAVQQRGPQNGISAPWQLEGPANIGARINCIAVHPVNQNIIYIGYSGGGIWKTTDGGNFWFPIFDDQTFLAISDIAIDPQNPNVIYAGTGDLNISGYPFIGDGVWKSTNAGATWEHLGLKTQSIISRIIVHPTDPNTLFASSTGIPFEANNDRGLYRSTNGGQSWEQVLFVSEQAGIIDMEIDPQNPDVLYAASWDRVRNNQQSIVSGPNGRIWKSTDGGDNWTMLTGGLPEVNMCRPGISIDKTNGQHLVASYAGTNLSFDNVYETFDGGANWEIMDQLDLNTGFQSSFAWYFGKLYINPYQPDDVWMLGVTSWRRPGAGSPWVEGAGFSQDVHADHHALAFLGPGVALLGTDGGLYKTTDNGITWTKHENIPCTQFYRVAWDPHSDVPSYYGGAQDNGSLTGNASTVDEWFRVYGGDGFQVRFHPEVPGLFYAEYQNGGIGYINNGDYQSGTDGLDDEDRRHWDMQYMISSHNPEIMYTGTYRPYMSTAGHPPFWEPVGPDLTDGIVFGSNFHTISTLDESPLDPERLYYGTNDGNVWRGNPFTQEWTNVSDGLPNRYVSSVKASPTLPNRVFVTQTGYKSNDFSPHIHRSDDGGDTWTPVSGDLPPLAVNDIVVLPGHADSVLFAATDGGIFFTSNDGINWAPLGTGLPHVPVYDIDVNNNEHTLIAGTHARSIYTYPLDSLQLGNDVSTYNPGRPQAEFAVQPTLANDHITLLVDQPGSSANTEVLIFDLSGKLLETHQFTGAGNKEVSVGHYAPGMYIAMARSKGKVWEQKKFVVGR